MLSCSQRDFFFIKKKYAFFFKHCLILLIFCWELQSCRSSSKPLGACPCQGTNERPERLQKGNTPVLRYKQASPRIQVPHWLQGKGDSRWKIALAMIFWIFICQALWSSLKLMRALGAQNMQDIPLQKGGRLWPTHCRVSCVHLFIEQSWG